MLKSIKLDNVPQSFAKIDPDGKYVLYEHLPYYADIISSHIQGFTKVYVNGEEYSLLTHDSNITKYGWIIRKLKPTAEEYKERRNILSRAGNKLDTNIWAERPRPSEE